MSCDRRCFDKDDKWFCHENCHTCAGQDSGRPMADMKACAECHAYHPIDKWPHEPKPSEQPQVVHILVGINDIEFY